jgi:hypothetical protein
VVPLEVEPDVLVVTPLTLVVLWLLVSVETTGAGMTGVVVCVVVVLEEEDCANAPPVTSVTAIAAASKVLIISNAPGTQARTEIARLGSVHRVRDALRSGSETTQSFPVTLSAPAAILMIFAMPAAMPAPATARFDDAPGQRE